MMHQTALVRFLALAGSVAAIHLHPRQNSSSTVAINNLSESGNARNGTGQVSASGSLVPFGDIGVGCGVNWAEDVSYGGGLTAGSDSFGLGGGFTIRPQAMQVDAGIGFTETNSSASIQFKGSANGTFELDLDATSAFICVPSYKDGKYTVKCTTAGGY